MLNRWTDGPDPTGRPVLLLVLCLLLIAGCQTEVISNGPPPERWAGVQVGLLSRAQIPESSGLVASRRFPGVFWTINDSGNRPELFAINGEGRLLRAYTVQGAVNQDWEDLAIDGMGNLYIGDIGDNDQRRPEAVIYRLPEPDPSAPGSAAVVSSRYRFRYSEGPADAESLFVCRNALYLITKRPPSVTLYHIPPNDSADKPRLAEAVVTMRFAGLVTAADMHPVTGSLVIRTYGAVWIFPKAAENLAVLTRRPKVVALFLGQSEGICWSGDDLMLTNEAGQLHRLSRNASPRPQER